ncbi:hypothetical protein K488DRAFT_89471 [Vararia minispora EC-137]|uniref:Uncharacterized protein n=1 Tax=Vararia minispora EC-137 TaxID=1314806 RepID=A0ACB8QA78_9AGAM|nr:hypothetical protein K488DRAFT_89471 [Vararia minispora EC-137]
MASTSVGGAGPHLSFAAVPVLLETALFGMYTLLLALTVFILVRKGISSPINAAMLVTVIIMYACAASHWSTSLFSFHLLLDTPPDSPASSLAGASSPSGAIVTTALIGVNVVLSDAIVVWRAHVLWGRNRAMLAVSCALVLFTAISILINLGVLIRSAEAAAAVASTGRFSVLASLGTLSSLVTNIWTASLTAVKVWLFRRDVARFLRSEGECSTERVLLLLVESGTLYCVFWTVAVISSFVQDFGPASSNGATPLSAILFSMLPQVSGIYPTTIIVGISLQNLGSVALFAPRQSEPTGSMHFASRGLTTMEQERSTIVSFVHVNVDDLEKGADSDGEKPWETYKVGRAF